MLSACCLITLYYKCRLAMGVLLQVSLKALILALHNWRPLLLLLVPAACWFYQSSLVRIYRCILRVEICWKRASEESFWKKGSGNERNWNCGTCFTNKKKVVSCQKLKIMNKWASDDDWQNVRENGSECFSYKSSNFLTGIVIGFSNRCLRIITRSSL